MTKRVGKAKAYKQLGEAVRDTLRAKSGLEPRVALLSETEHYKRVKTAIARFGIDYDASSRDTRYTEERFLAALIKYWKVNKHPPTHDEWAESAGLKSNGRTSTIIKRLCNSGKIIRIETGKWRGKYVPVD